MQWIMQNSGDLQEKFAKIPTKNRKTGWGHG
jgi:hypothetical protein